MYDFLLSLNSSGEKKLQLMECNNLKAFCFKIIPCMYIANISLKVITVSAAATTFMCAYSYVCLYLQLQNYVYSPTLYVILHALLYAYNILNYITTIARDVPACIVNA